MHTLLESKSIFAIEQKAIVSCFVINVALLLGHPVFHTKSRFLSLAFERSIQIRCPWGLRRYSSPHPFQIMDVSIFKQDRIFGAFFQSQYGIFKGSHWIIKGSNCNQISILKGSHQDLKTITVG